MHETESQGTIDPRAARAGTSTMRTLALRYPELSVFTPGATLTEIKLRYGLDNLDAVRDQARDRQAARTSPSDRRSAG